MTSFCYLQLATITAFMITPNGGVYEKQIYRVELLERGGGGRCLSSSVGLLQLCAGAWSWLWIEIQAMHKIYEEDKSEGIWLLDASNAFNSVNRKTFIHNIGIICPLLAKFVWNCHNLSSQLFINGGGEIWSTEGTTQDNPTAMGIYAIGIIPLILIFVNITD